MRLLPLVLALGMVAPTRARARARAAPDPLHDPPPEKQPRRSRPRAEPRFTAQRSPCGRHVVEVDGGAVFVDGRRVHTSAGSVTVLSAPSWRADGEALAWLERGAGETRLVVLPSLRGAAAMAWPLPRVLGGERVFWADAHRVVIGPEALQPRAIASFDE
jgi:hypothetical protein